jgi:ribosome maturation protein SDO1
MSQQINLPINRVRLTNVAVVRMNKGGKRFEIACYRNKVVNYRQGLEQDLSEVLQTERVFTNVSKGEFAKAKDLMQVFGTKDEEEIIQVILTKGQLQVSDKERTQQLEKTNAQISEWIANNCVHPTSDRPYTNSQIRHAMQQANFSVHPTKPLKRQYLDCVKVLQSVIPITRAKMELMLIVPGPESPRVEEAMKSNNVTWTSQTDDTEHHKHRILVDPSLYRVLNEVMQTIDGARIEIINQVVTKQGDVSLETEVPEGIMDVADNTEDQVVTDQLHDMSLQESNSKTADSDDDEEDGTASRRQQQRKSRKKNKKQMRRAADNKVDDEETAQQQPASSSSIPVSAASNPGNSADSTRKSCNTCGGGFDSAAAYRSHFKSDWHRFNQKLKLKGATPISEQEFLLCDADTFFSDVM